MSRRLFTRRLRALGCRTVHDGRTHTVWQNPAGTAVATVPFDDPLPAEFIQAVCAALGVPAPPPEEDSA
jgi:hypothetical protein